MRKSLLALAVAALFLHVLAFALPALAVILSEAKDPDTLNPHPTRANLSATHP